MAIIQTLIRRSAFAVLLLVSVCPDTLLAEENILEYYFDDLTFLDEENHHLFEQVQILLQNERFEPAQQNAKILIDNNPELAETDPILYGKLLTNLGILLSAQGFLVEAMEVLDPALASIEARANPFSTTLTNVVMARGLTQTELENFADAEESFRRAQHISHRAGGVYTPEQMEIVDHLTRLNLRQGKVVDADREQAFNLRISEHAYGEESEKLLPILQRLGAYFASRGKMIPLATTPDYRYYREDVFRRSINLYQRAIKIIEDNYGVSDLRLVEPLRGLARARLLQITNRSKSEAALERVLSIVEANPDTDLPDRITAMVNLGDIYTITGDKRAKSVYLQTWQLMQEDEAQMQLSAETFGSPTRLYPEGSSVLYLSRRPDAAKKEDAELFIDVEYSISKSGRVTNLELLDKNVPNAQVRNLRSRLSATRFRPRIIDGELVATDNLMIHQTYRVAASAPTDASISTTEGNEDLSADDERP